MFDRSHLCVITLTATTIEQRTNGVHVRSQTDRFDRLRIYVLLAILSILAASLHVAVALEMDRRRFDVCRHSEVHTHTHATVQNVIRKVNKKMERRKNTTNAYIINTFAGSINNRTPHKR